MLKIDLSAMCTCISKNVVLLLLSMGVSGSGLAFELSDVADPPDANVTYVGEVVQNGLPLQMKQFTVEQSVSEVLSFYKQRWSDTANTQENVPHYIEKRAGQWRVLSKVEGTSSVVVQVKDGPTRGITEGLVSVTDLSKKKEVSQLSHSFPRLTDTELLSSTESVDNGRLATTLMLVNNYSIDDNSDYYRSQMDEQGWSFLRGGVQNNVSMLHFAKDGQQCEIAVSPMDNGKTVVFANVVESNEDGQ